MMPEHAFTTEDVTYRTIGGIELQARLYRPEGDHPVPYVMESHGGAWRNGDRLNNLAIHEHFAKNGIGVFAIDFRLSEVAAFPGPVQDVNVAIRWFKAHAAELGLNPSKIGGLGSSSGGQQMGLIALQPTHPDYAVAADGAGSHDASLDFFIGCWPILDPLARYRMAQEQGKDRLVENHNIYFADEAEMEAGNPYMALERGEATHLPPALIIQGTADDNVEHERADIFAALYREKGGEIEVKKFIDQPHTFAANNPDSDAAQEAFAAMSNFVHAQTS